MTQKPLAYTGMSIDDMPLPEIPVPPTDLPYDDGEPMESPWHFRSAALLLAGYGAARGGRRDDYFMGANMFVYYSEDQILSKDFKGPDVFVVLDVDGTRERLSWITWAEYGRYPDVIFELLSPSTEKYDLGDKKQLYAQTFRTGEYFCIAPELERLLGWRLRGREYLPIKPDERGWLWSEQLGLWLGPWRGEFLQEEHTYARFYDSNGNLILLPEEAALRDLEQERRRADAEAAARAEAEAELARLRAELERLQGGKG
jgi:Uma2 family endonuclease